VKGIRSKIAAGFHPVAFAGTYVLYLWIETALSVYAIGRALIIALGLALVLVFAGSIAFRDIRRGSLLASAVIAFLIFARELWLIARNIAAAMPAWQVLILTSLVIALCISALVVARRSDRRMLGAGTWTRLLNSVAAAFLLIVVATGIAGGAIGRTLDDLRQGVDLAAIPDRTSVLAAGPDIYVILLDGYPRADVLSRRFDFDNAAFLDDLEARGLAVAPASHSNYLLTQFTLVSMFSGQLIQDIPDLKPVFDGAPAQPVSRRILNDNRTFATLRDRGYVIAGLAGTYEDVALRQAEIFLETGHINELEWRLVSHTFVVDVVDALWTDFFSDHQRAFIDSSFDQAERVARDRHIGRRFLFAHVFAPRAPLVLGPAGEDVDAGELRRTDDTAEAAGLSLDEYAARLRGQVQYINGRTLDLIDAILEAAPQPPVIIVMSDHGARSEAMDLDEPDPELIRERFATLFAAYTPGRVDVFPPDVAPVQVMNLLLSSYFGVPYEEPRSGIFANGADHYALLPMGEAPPTPSPTD
jgi:hypothetical protein